jgi:hypothetical protein
LEVVVEDILEVSNIPILVDIIREGLLLESIFPPLAEMEVEVEEVVELEEDLQALAEMEVIMCRHLLVALAQFFHFQE